MQFNIESLSKALLTHFEPLYTNTVTHKIMYTVINFFFLGLSCSGKKGGNLEKFIRVEQASEHKKINFAQCKVNNF